MINSDRDKEREVWEVIKRQREEEGRGEQKNAPTAS